MGRSPESPPSFPSSGPCAGATLSSAGSLGLVPLPHRYYCGTPKPRRSSSPHFVSSFGGTPAPAAAGHRGSDGGSQVPGDPLCTCPALRPRWTSVPGPCASSRSSTLVLPSANATASAPTTIFRGSITRPTHSLSTLRSQGRPLGHARLASGWGQPCPGGLRETHAPLGSVVRFQFQLIPSSFPRLLLAHCKPLLGRQSWQAAQLGTSITSATDGARIARSCQRSSS